MVEQISDREIIKEALKMPGRHISPFEAFEAMTASLLITGSVIYEPVNAFFTIYPHIQLMAGVALAITGMDSMKKEGLENMRDRLIRNKGS